MLAVNNIDDYMKHHKKKKWLIAILGSLTLLFILSFMIDTETDPPEDTVVIFEKTKQMYIAPPCFEQANVTNNLAQGPLKKAKKRDYRVQTPCSKKALTPKKEPIMIKLLKSIGILQTKNGIGTMIAKRDRQIYYQHNMLKNYICANKH